jgi:hypothetical protein
MQCIWWVSGLMCCVHVQVITESNSNPVIIHLMVFNSKTLQNVVVVVVVVVVVMALGHT